MKNFHCEHTWRPQSAQRPRRARFTLDRDSPDASRCTCPVPDAYIYDFMAQPKGINYYVDKLGSSAYLAEYLLKSRLSSKFFFFLNYYFFLN